MDLGDNVDTCRQESLRAPGYRERPSFNPEVGPHHKGEPEEGQETADREGGSIGGGTVGVGPPSALGSLAPYQGVVQGCGRPCSAARSGYPRADHGREGGTVPLLTDPGDEHPHFRAAIPVGLLGAYGGRGRVGVDATTKSLLQGAVGYEGVTPKEVADDGAKGKKGRDGGNNNSKGGDEGEQRD